MHEILLVEDNEGIVMGLEYLLTEQGFSFSHAGTIGKARELLEQKRFDLVLLDVRLPDGNGFSLCQEIKKRDLAAVIFLTARDEENHVVQGFDLGADDYVMKPFRNMELVSRIKNVLRRTGKEQPRLEFHGISIDVEAGKVYCGTEELKLTKLEYKIMVLLFSNPKRLFTRDEILGAVWDIDGNFVNDNTLTVTMKRLRAKISDQNGTIIETVRGRGYRLGEEKHEPLSE